MNVPLARIPAASLRENLTAADYAALWGGQLLGRSRVSRSPTFSPARSRKRGSSGISPRTTGSSRSRARPYGTGAASGGPSTTRAGLLLPQRLDAVARDRPRRRRHARPAARATFPHQLGACRLLLGGGPEAGTRPERHASRPRSVVDPRRAAAPAASSTRGSTASGTARLKRRVARRGRPVSASPRPRPILYWRVSPANEGLVFALPRRAEEIDALHRAISDEPDVGRLPRGDARRRSTSGSSSRRSTISATGAAGARRTVLLGRVPGLRDGDYPPWLQKEMDWVLPSEVIERFGRRLQTAINGVYLHFDEEYRAPDRRDAHAGRIPSCPARRPAGSGEGDRQMRRGQLIRPRRSPDTEDTPICPICDAGTSSAGTSP